MANKIIEQAQELLKSAQKIQKSMREFGKECNEFIAGYQWDDDDIQARGKKPTLTINILSKPVDSVVNRLYKNRKSIKIKAFEENDVDTVRVINGLINHIENHNNSDGRLAYHHAIRCAGIRGYGYWRINTQYAKFDPFIQDIVIEKIKNPDTVYMLDETQCLIVEKMTKKEFKRKYKQAETESWDSTDNPMALNEDELYVAEYWVREPVTVRKYKILTQDEDTQVVTEDELRYLDGFQILEEKDCEEHKVTQYFITPSEILDQTVWYGDIIPIVGVYGSEFQDKHGNDFYKSIIHDSISSQKLLNYALSQEAEVIQAAPKNKPVGAEGQFDGHEEEWTNPDDYPYIEYKPMDVMGKPLPSPFPYPTPQLSPAIAKSIEKYEDYVKATSGIYDPSLGLTPPEQSGRAIVATQSASDLATGQLDISLDMALRKTGVIIVGMIPKIMDSQRMIQILGEDMREETVTINKRYVDNKGQEQFFDLTKAINCDISVQASYSAGTKRQETYESLLQLIKEIPGAGQVSGDIIASQLDMEKAEELSKRLRAMIPPQIFDRIEQMDAEEKGGMELDYTQKLMKKMQGMQKELITVTEDAKRFYKENQALKKKIDDTKIQVARINTEGDIEEEHIKKDAKIEAELIKSGRGVMVGRESGLKHPSA